MREVAAALVVRLNVADAVEEVLAGEHGRFGLSDTIKCTINALAHERNQMDKDHFDAVWIKRRQVECVADSRLQARVVLQGC